MALGMALSIPQPDGLAETMVRDQRWNRWRSRVGHAQHLGDDGRRDGQGVVADEVHAPPPCGRGEQFVGQRLDAAAHLLDQAGRERPMHQGPQPRVVGRVEVEHVPLERPEHARDPGLLGGLLGGQGGRLVLDEAFVLQDRRHVVVAGDEPGRLPVRQGHAVDRGSRRGGGRRTDTGSP